MSDTSDSSFVQAELAQYHARSALFTRPGFLIRRLHQIHTWLFTEETQAFNITPVQYSLLTALAEHGEMDQNTLAYEIGLERTSVAEVLPRLEARGVVERQQAEHDKRVKLVKISRKGRALVKRMAEAAQRAHDRTIEQLPPEERERFMLQLIKLVEAHNDSSVVPLKLR
ncbi:MAG: MarR family winged helix-turn-helix transcriptional regulator [Aquincola tertiaricarbonis]